MSITFNNIAFVANNSPDAQAALKALSARHENVPVEQSDVIVALGGDGFMLQTQHEFMNSNIPVYGMNKGTIGFLMNDFREDGLMQRLESAIMNKIHPLKMLVEDSEGREHRAMAFNEVSTFRQSHQAAKIRISIDDKVRMEALVCDGVMVATPQGSTAYNLSAHGPILPLNAPLLALTAVSPFRPRNWRGALLPNSVEVRFDVLEPEKRPVNAVADHTEFKSIISVRISEDRKSSGLLLFDPDHSWDERILAEQFTM